MPVAAPDRADRIESYDFGTASVNVDPVDRTVEIHTCETRAADWRPVRRLLNKLGVTELDEPVYSHGVDIFTASY